MYLNSVSGSHFELIKMLHCTTIPLVAAEQHFDHVIMNCPGHDFLCSGEHAGTQRGGGQALRPPFVYGRVCIAWIRYAELEEGYQYPHCITVSFPARYPLC